MAVEERLWEKKGFKTRVENVTRNVKSVAGSELSMTMEIADQTKMEHKE